MSAYVVSHLAARGRNFIAAPAGGGHASSSTEMEVDYITGKKGGKKGSNNKGGKGGKEQKGKGNAKVNGKRAKSASKDGATIAEQCWHGQEQNVATVGTDKAGASSGPLGFGVLKGSIEHARGEQQCDDEDQSGWIFMVGCTSTTPKEITISYVSEEGDSPCWTAAPSFTSARTSVQRSGRCSVRRVSSPCDL